MRLSVRERDAKSHTWVVRHRDLSMIASFVVAHPLIIEQDGYA